MRQVQPSPQEVFPAVGTPTYTYVKREDGQYERQLMSGLTNPGQICLLTGPSKTGKTSLYKKVLPDLQRQAVTIRCTGKLSPSDFWASALEELNFESIAERSSTWGIDTSAKIGIRGEAGWSWIAKMLASIGFNVKGSGQYQIKKEVVRAGIGSKHLIPILKELPVQLIVEDFHYLEEQTKIEIFQQWKAFVDEGVSVLLVSTTHHAADIARSNPDLSGRTRFINVDKWSEADLSQIPDQGFRILNINSTAMIHRKIAAESVGLPIITQQICQEIAVGHDNSPGRRRSANVQIDAVSDALDYVANNLYTNHKGDYDLLITGPRKRRRKHATYEKILASFALDPLRYSLPHHELLKRIEQLNSGGEKIPTQSINTALKALGKFQERARVRLLDWHESEKILYIAEPSFLFYLRQKLDNAAGDDIAQKLMNILTFIDKNGDEISMEVKLSHPVSKRLPLDF